MRHTLDIQVRHPDGRIWHVRRRWAKRRPPWRRPDRETGRQRSHQPRASAADAEPVLSDEDIPVWPVATVDVLRDLSSLVGLPSLAGLLPDLPGLLLLAIGAVALLAVWLLLVWVGAGAATAVVWLVHHPGVVAAAAAILLLLAAVLLVRRPWLVVAERQGLADAPRRAWRLIGWRRSGRFARAMAEAIRDGRFDAAGVLVVSPPHEPREVP